MWSQALPLKCAGMALKAMTKLFWAGSISGSQSVCVCVWFGLKGVVREPVYGSSRVGASKRFKTWWNVSDALLLPFLSVFVWVQFLVLFSFFSTHTHAQRFLITDLSRCFSSSGTTSRKPAMSLSVVPCLKRCGRMPPCCPCMRARSWARWRGWTKKPLCCQPANQQTNQPTNALPRPTKS